ncbi:hypothetical protein [Pseudomonas sp. R16(2017)]|uniref:P-loop ATPase, Sll1717 family n=1 Tax=Pseudomonas sp. R16(2017) TaxID=1981704 RepID=UPI00111BF63F|nr:hypothetical protein [Pseudomonas sp. R16(2017)]
MHQNFSMVDWGPDEAKGDKNISNYFFPIDGFSDIKSGKIRYVIGRKGSGKTAIIEKIKSEMLDSPTAFFSQLSLRSFPTASFNTLQDRAKSDKSKYVAAWQFILYVELAKLVLLDNGAKPTHAIEDLHTFLSINNFDSGIGFSETVNILTENKNKVTVKGGWLSIENNSGGSEQTLIKVHFNKAVEILSKLLFQVESESEYRLFFDELDEGYSSDDQRLNLMILALIRAIEDSALLLRSSSLNFNPLLVLRSDIYDILEDNDLNKIDDYMLFIRWSLDPKITAGDTLDGEKLMTLRNVVNSRIAASISISSTISDTWHTVAIDEDQGIPYSVGSLWKYMANRTFERPRDIIKFLKISAKYQKQGRLRYAAVEQAEIDYSDWLYKEIKDEIQSHLPVWRESLQAITRIGRGRFSLEDFETSLKKDSAITKWLESSSKSAINIAELLFKFGIIGNLENRRWLFGYKDNALTFDPDMELIVHYGLHKKLRLLKSKGEYLSLEPSN